MLKVGDKIVETAWDSVRHMPVRVLTVVRVTKTLAILDNGTRAKINADPARLEEITEAEAYTAEKKRRSEEAERQRQAEQADPKYQFLRRLKGGGDFEPWELLSIDKLETITKWLDEAKEDDEQTSNKGRE